MDDRHEITFEWPHSEPSTVIVTGTFDQWSSSITLTKEGTGFKATTRIPWEEKIAYKFIVDGNWTTTPSQPTETDASGNVNNVYTAPSKPPPPPMETPEAVVAPETVEAKADTNGADIKGDVISTVAATEGTSTTMEYVASGIGAAIQAVVGVDPINPVQAAVEEQQAAPAPEPEVKSEAVVEPPPPTKVAPIVPIEIVPVNAPENNEPSPQTETSATDSPSTHTPSILPISASPSIPSPPPAELPPPIVSPTVVPAPELAPVSETQVEGLPFVPPTESSGEANPGILVSEAPSPPPAVEEVQPSAPVPEAVPEPTVAVEEPKSAAPVVTASESVKPDTAAVSEPVPAADAVVAAAPSTEAKIEDREARSNGVEVPAVSKPADVPKVEAPSTNGTAASASAPSTPSKSQPFPSSGDSSSPKASPSSKSGTTTSRKKRSSIFGKLNLKSIFTHDKDKEKEKK